MQLVRFRVEKFRSIEDSGWVECLQSTCLIGTNEAGKTNLLLALWKLNPANDEPINPLVDYPRKDYHIYNSDEKKYGDLNFVYARFYINQEVADMCKAAMDKAEDGTVANAEKINIDNILVEVSRNYAREHNIKIVEISSDEIIPINKTIEKIILDKLPKFVYYSDYGNLDSEIYLPTVVETINKLQQKSNIGLTAQQKARTLKVLFDFVKLTPNEILGLGIESADTSKAEDKNKAIISDTEKKRKREILLQSASETLTNGFKKWWQQGTYKFRLQADGKHFRIWVSDEKRASEIELEGRSRGLQWFFSFFLVFLVESKASHNNCILLLDEPGLSLHPMAQKDLIVFFESLSRTNQLLYTTHSPFLVDANSLASVKAVYLSESGSSSVSDDLRKNSIVSKEAVYPVNAAIGITVSDSLLIGCQPIIVEGISDLFYFNSIKNYLLKKGKYVHDRELVFIPSGGAKGIAAIASLVSAKEGDLPFVIIDGDKQGESVYNKLKGELYKDSMSKLILLSEVIFENKAVAWETEDLLPSQQLAELFSRKYRAKEDNEDFEDFEDFEDIYKESEPILPQMENFAKSNNIELELGWKVDLAKKMQSKMQHSKTNIDEASEAFKRWEKLFNSLTNKSLSVK